MRNLISRACFSLVISFFLFQPSSKAEEPYEMPRMTVTGTTMGYLPGFWYFLDQLFSIFDPNEETAEINNEEDTFVNDFWERHQTTSCESSVEVRAEYAAVQAGFASVGTRYRVNYPAGGWQMWVIMGNTDQGRDVQADSPCYQS